MTVSQILKILDFIYPQLFFNLLCHRWAHIRIKAYRPLQLHNGRLMFYVNILFKILYIIMNIFV